MVTTIYEGEVKKNKRENKYYVDLIPSIIDVYNKSLFCIVDNIQSIDLDF